MSEYVIVLIVVGLGVAAVLIPLLRSGGATHTPLLNTDAEIEDAVSHYRSALRGGTVCRKCLRANPAGSRYCADCGRALENAKSQAPGTERTPPSEQPQS